MESTPEAPAGLRERVDALKAQVAEAQRGVDLVVALEDWRREMLDGRAYLDREAAAGRFRELFAAHGVDPANPSEDVRQDPGFRAALADWLAVSPDENERSSIGQVLESLPGGPSSGMGASGQSGRREGADRGGRHTHGAAPPGGQL